ncbi:hypothetical protein J0H33_04105 [bacterium]|nr:hypothetical protein [bacterium]
MESSDFPIDAIITQVMALLDVEAPDNWRDIYVWSDGSVTGPRDAESSVGDLKLVCLFTPSEGLPTADSIRASIVNGLSAVDASAP